MSNQKAARGDIDSQFHNVYLQAERLAEKLSVIPSLLRIVTSEINQINLPLTWKSTTESVTTAITLLYTPIS